MKYNPVVRSVQRSVAGLLLVSFVAPPFSVFAQEAESSGTPPIDTNSAGYQFAVERGKEMLGENFSLSTIKQWSSAPEGQAPNVAEGTSGGESMLMSQSDPLINTYLYDVANDLRSQVSGTSGAFSHSIPIVIPPGRNGMEPTLELRYSNQTSDELNVAGYGWDIPIPYIERVNKRGTDLLYSTTTDQYFRSSLSGELATTTNSSEYGARSDDGSFLRYEFASSTNKWTVTDKSGATYKFGHGTTTRQDNPSDASEVYKWMLEEVRDTNGNCIKYEYFKDSGFIYPSLITYTGNGITDGIFTVDLNFESRPDNATSTDAGFEAEARYRIDEILISVDGEWVRKYELAYTTGDNDRRSLLDSVTETGRSETGTTVSLPQVNFDYQASIPGWATTTSDFSLPEKFNSGGDYKNTGTRIVDVNGDALPDIVRAQEGTTTKVYINDGEEWNLDTNWVFPEYFADADGIDLGTRLADLNGDGLVDILRREDWATSTAYLNTGSDWATTTSWQSPLPLSTSAGSDTGVRLADVNGDGLVDLLWSEYYPQSGFGNAVVYLNSGASFVTSDWDIPIAFRNLWAVPDLWVETLGGVIEDVNNDGLADLVTGDTNQAGAIDEGVFLNTGSGWTHEPSWVTPELLGAGGNDQGQRLADVNGDNLADWLGYGELYINDGANWIHDSSWAVPVGFGSGDGYSAHIADVNGDGMADIMQRNDDVHNRWLNKGKRVDTLVHVDESSGSKVDISYKSSARFIDQSGDELNPHLPFLLHAVETVRSHDGLGNYSTTTYEYHDGSFYYVGSFDRTLAGFGTVTKTDGAGYVTKTYYHQGNATASTSGEYDDHRAKIGRAYRLESYDNGGNLYALQVSKWDRSSRGGDAHFVQHARSTSLVYDGDGDHRDSAETYSYSTTTGALTERIAWGEVTGSSDGSFTDTGTDKQTTALSYAASSTGYLILPSQETVTNQSGTKIRETKSYYDTLSHGGVSKGNLTKQEMWKTGSIYIDVEKTYNSYGLVTEERDPRDKLTTHTYDSFNLYPATTTNPLSHVTARLFDYSSGKVKQTKDPNGRVFQSVYDGLDRITEEKQPDLTTPSTLVTKAAFTYTDTGMPRKIQRTGYLSAATSTDTYTYLDGKGRTIEERTEAEGTYAVKDFTYNTSGLIETESLPYFSSGTTYTGTSSPAASSLLIRYTYDPLQRVLSVANSVGTTTNAYDQWAVTTTDAGGSIKEFQKDAYGNLVEVVEHNGGSEYSTLYEYDGNSRITKITDAQGNVRNFTYDGLGRRLSAEDLHDTGDGTFGTWTYAYDAAGNLASSTDPKSQVVEYTYDDLNRVLTENYTGSGGTDVSYGYDTCPDGKGRLCAATTTDATTNNEYNALGLLKKETKTLNGTGYVTEYLYDRLGNTTNITYPDNSEVAYAYNAAGLLESVAGNESGGSFAAIVSDFDYAPTGKVTYKEFANGVTSTYTYDETELYRLTDILTTASSSGESLMGGGGGGLGLLRSSKRSTPAPQVPFGN